MEKMRRVDYECSYEGDEVIGGITSYILVPASYGDQLIFNEIIKEVTDYTKFGISSIKIIIESIKEEEVNL